MLIYQQRSGIMWGEGLEIATGYSGFSYGKNDPLSEPVHEIGPIPAGAWMIGLPYDTDTHGPFVLPLTARPDTKTYGRAGFLIHGDSKTDPGSASRGCIILPRYARELIAERHDQTLYVVPGSINLRGLPYD